VTRGEDGATLRARAGQCGMCRHARLIASDRGSTFLLCRLSREDPRFVRYPRLPMVRCPGYEADTARDGEPAGSGADGSRTADAGGSPEGEEE